ncbi:hypothetical protein Y032_0033g2757 [Ancylostoma ceylanicum]|uniref:Uncharacterized protein n=1 Tax=Ancylostoma ceylanicum TaxID=53326 RepID=A0A016UN87_9BILA|nr:hypothetical protein Y032_0033g2757 [Ancylostoma ceylanicum]
MLPVKEVNGDQRPLSPRDKDEKDENANQTAAKSATTAAAAAAAASQPSTSKAGAAPAKEAAPKDPDTVPPFSCTPVYVVILLAIFLVLVVGAITTIIDMRPELIYGRRANTTLSPLNSTIPV